MDYFKADKKTKLLLGAGAGYLISNALSVGKIAIENFNYLASGENVLQYLAKIFSDGFSTVNNYTPIVVPATIAATALIPIVYKGKDVLELLKGEKNEKNGEVE